MVRKKEVKKPAYKIARDLDILEMSSVQGMTVKEIAATLQVSKSLVWHTLSALSNIDNYGNGDGDIYDYLDIGLEVAAMLDEAGCGPDIDRCTTLIMNELWVNGFYTREKIGNMTDDEIERFKASHRIHRAGYFAVECFLAWQAEVHRDTMAKAKTKKKRTAK